MVITDLDSSKVPGSDCIRLLPLKKHTKETFWRNITPDFKHTSWTFQYVPERILFSRLLEGHIGGPCIFKDAHNRRSHRKCFVRKGVLRNFAKFTGKHLCQSLFYRTPLGNCFWHNLQYCSCQNRNISCYLFLLIQNIFEKENKFPF